MKWRPIFHCSFGPGSKQANQYHYFGTRFCSKNLIKPNCVHPQSEYVYQCLAKVVQNRRMRCVKCFHEEEITGRGKPNDEDRICIQSANTMALVSQFSCRQLELQSWTPMDIEENKYQEKTKLGGEKLAIFYSNKNLFNNLHSHL